MGGFRQGRLPKASARARRNSQRWGEEDLLVAPDGGLQFTADGLSLLVSAPLTLTSSGAELSFGSGLALAGSDLVVDLATDAGLEFVSGDLSAKVAAPIALDSTGIHLDFGTGLTTAAGVLILDSHTHTLSDITDSGTMAAQDSDAVDISGGEIDGTDIGLNDPARGYFQTDSPTVEAFRATGAASQSEPIFNVRDNALTNHFQVDEVGDIIYSGAYITMSQANDTAISALTRESGAFREMILRHFGSLNFIIDSNNTSTSQEFRVLVDGLTTGAATELFTIRENGRIDVLGRKFTDANSDLFPRTVTNATRPAAGAPGRVVFNSDDGNLNIDDGTNWILPDGTTT